MPLASGILVLSTHGMGLREFGAAGPCISEPTKRGRSTAKDPQWSICKYFGIELLSLPRIFRRGGAPAELLVVGGQVTLPSSPARAASWRLTKPQLDKAPWFGSKQHYRCGGRVDWHIHGPAWQPSYFGGELPGRQG
jgi:hypothetical protein